MPWELERRPRVLIACPNGRAWIHKLVVFKVIAMLNDRRFDTTFIAPTHKPYVHNLHLIQRDLLKGNWDFLLSIDDDNPPFANPLDLALLDLDIVGCPTPVWHCDTKNAPNDRPYYFNALREVRAPDGSVAFSPLDSFPDFGNPIGIKAADAVGTGCILIARRVLERLKAPFNRVWNDDGTVEMGNDYAFCRRARAAGFSVWAHFDYTCMHFNELELTESINALMRFKLEGQHGSV